MEMGKIISKDYPSFFFELARIMNESILTQKETVLCDMPELLLRMKIGANYSLSELQDMFNAVMN